MNLVMPGQAALIIEDGVLIFTGEVAGDLERVVRRDRDERVKKLAGGYFRTRRPRRGDQGTGGTTVR